MMRFPKIFLVSVVALTTALTACSEGSPPEKPSPSASSAPSPPAKPVVASTITVNNASSLSPDLAKHPLVVKSDHALLHVQLSGEEAGAIKWKRVTANEWHAQGNLKFASPYFVTVVDETQVKTLPLSTIIPADTVSPTLFPYEGTMGVGMPITVNFREPIKDKKWAQEHLRVKTTPEVEGSWGWLDDERAVWRPKTFWKPGTKVSVHVDLEGVETAPGEYGKRDVNGSFVIA